MNRRTLFADRNGTLYVDEEKTQRSGLRVKATQVGNRIEMAVVRDGTLPLLETVRLTLDEPTR